MHVVIDRTATFTPPSGAAVLSIGRPHRIVDTRNSDARVPAGGVVSFSVGDTDLITPQTDPTTSGIEAVAFSVVILILPTVGSQNWLTITLLDYNHCSGEKPPSSSHQRGRGGQQSAAPYPKICQSRLQSRGRILISM